LSAHDAFNYFGSAYGFEVTGIQGISTESEAGLQRIAELVDMLVDRDIRAVFVESSVSDRNIRALIEGAAARGHEVVIGGELFSDAMGAEGHLRGHLCRHDRPQRDGHRRRPRRRGTGSWHGGVAELMTRTDGDTGVSLPPGSGPVHRIPADRDAALSVRGLTVSYAEKPAVFSVDATFRRRRHDGDHRAQRRRQIHDAQGLPRHRAAPVGRGGGVRPTGRAARATASPTSRSAPASTGISRRRFSTW
jgi:hypothetical protein